LLESDDWRSDSWRAETGELKAGEQKLESKSWRAIAGEQKLESWIERSLESKIALAGELEGCRLHRSVRACQRLL
jgi:hypothetical protein